MKVYVVTSGEYSDYSIDAVFLDKEKADRYVKVSNMDGPEYRISRRIEVYDSDRDFFEYTECQIGMRKDGSLVEEPTFRRYVNDFVPDSSARVYPDYGHENNGIPFLYCSIVFPWAEQRDGDMERAIKIANEKRTMVIANNEWDIGE